MILGTARPGVVVSATRADGPSRTPPQIPLVGSRVILVEPPATS